MQPILAGSTFTLNKTEFISRQKYVNHQPKWLPKSQIGWEHVPSVPTFLQPCLNKKQKKKIQVGRCDSFHQVPLHTASHVIFQSHLGLNRMRRLFFGPTNRSGIFHHEVTKVFAGLEG